ncbi:MAG: hypothetical protein DRP85_08510 [Candidatus Makaraimicrobium thalassicum]|nr:MAG: hypothetical protein DRP85_08510 [Candidatus Omnitrophota bacterium]
MMQAKIAEIFLSYQGEGLFTGSRQLFIRFYGCDLGCVYCDTVLKSYRSFSRHALLGKILDFGNGYNELTLTGGEPLLHADFLKEFLPLFRKHKGHGIYLETNGTLPDELEKVLDLVDIIAMDFKLPSSTGSLKEVWTEHERFIRTAACCKELIVKAVITDSTTIDDIKQMSRIIAGVEKEFAVILQPVTPVNALVKEPDEEMISYFKGYVAKETGKETRILGQAHHHLGIK